MVELTPDLAGTSLVVAFIVYFIAFIFNVYMLYLNWKQSKVRETTAHMLEEIKKTNKLLEEIKAGLAKKQEIRK
ncbi:MAG TPA: hypothetical protein VJ461_00040 [Candidatus Nanoarchaeia archaeon]|nr:hypothetical protein [Candidatus Nanoarchaeia archaeon]